MLNQNGVNLIKNFEKCSLTSYQDVGGVWTNGWGETGPDIGPGVCWTQEEADARFDQRIRGFCHALDSLLPPTLNDNQYSAVCSLAYNIGVGAISNSTLLRKLQTHAPDADAEFLRWNHIDGVVNEGLTRRRQKERELFNLPPGGLLVLE